MQCWNSQADYRHLSDQKKLKNLKQIDIILHYENIPIKNIPKFEQGFPLYRSTKLKINSVLAATKIAYGAKYYNKGAFLL